MRETVAIGRSKNAFAGCESTSEYAVGRTIRQHFFRTPGTTTH